MIYFKNFRYQIIILICVSFALLWGGGILVFNHYANESLSKEKQLKYDYDERLITAYFDKLTRDLQLINQGLSSYLSDRKIKDDKIKGEAENFWALNHLKNKNIELSYYDNENNYSHIYKNGMNPFFTVKDKLPQSVVSKHKNTLEGKVLTYCSQACRYIYIMPSVGNRFDKGVFQVSYSFTDILNDLLRELPSAKLVIFRAKDDERFNVEEMSSLQLHKSIMGSIKKEEKQKVVSNNDSSLLINLIEISPHKDFTFAVVHDTKSLQENFDKLYYNYYYVSIFILTVVVLVFIVFLRMPIRRINLISSILGIIGEGGFDRAKYLLNKSKRDKVYDELDMIHSTTHQLVGQLDNMHKSLTHSNQQLTDKINEVTYLADHDSLTGVYNRRRFGEELKKIHESGAPFCLASIDMDHFKLVNDSLGHHAGDVLLQQFSRILLDTVGTAGIVGRLGGDEFAVVLQELDTQFVAKTFDTIVTEAKKIKFNENAIFRVGASVGVSFYPEDTTSLDELSSFSDAAMYENKRFKTANFNVYTGTETLIKEEKLAQHWSRIVQEALNEKTIKLLFQPIVAQRSGKLLGYEVLSRVEHNGDLISPSRYIDYIEKNKCIIQYDRLVFELALEKGSSQLNQPRLMINLSYYSITSINIVDYILAAVKRHAYPPEKITFEITERSEITNFDKAFAFVSSLKKHGFSFSLDDFGAGFSSFFYLTQLPIDYLKVDKKIVAGLLDNPVDHHILKSIILLTKNLNIKIIAEGVETKQLKTLMLDYEVEFLQGYYILHPVAAEQLTIESNWNQQMVSK